MGVILLEGMDNTGKSTLFKRILAVAPRLTLTLASKDAGADTKKRMNTILAIANSVIHGSYEFNVLLDRVHVISEEIYGPVIRGSSTFGDCWEEYWQRFLELDPVVIYCRPPRDLIFENIEKRAQMEGVVDRGAALLKAYDTFIGEKIVLEIPSDKFYVYDYTQDPEAKILITTLKERGQLLWETEKF